MHNLKKTMKTMMIKTPILPVLIIFFILSMLFVPNFSTVYNLKNLLLQTSDILIVSCGLTFVVLNGGIDFSVTATLTLASVIGAYIMALSSIAVNPVLAIIVAIVVMLVIGLIIGLINGVAVAKFKIPSFIATMATQLTFTGIAVLFAMTVTGKASINGITEGFFVLGGIGNYFIIPIIISLTVFLFSHWLLTYTKFGREVYAIGNNNLCADISGISVAKTTIKIMVISGVLAALAGIILTARNEAGVASLGDKMFISIISCVIVGGTSTAGGSGGVKNTFYGVLFITLLNNAMNLLRVEWNLLMVFQGILILIAMFTAIKVKKTRTLKLVEKKNEK